MATDNFELMGRANRALNGKWTLAAFSFLLYGIIQLSINIDDNREILFPKSVTFVLSCLSFLISGSMAVGASIFSLSIARDEETRIELFFYGFKNFLTAFLVRTLSILIIALWALITLIPLILVLITLSIANGSTSLNSNNLILLIKEHYGIFSAIISLTCIFSIPTIIITAISYSQIFFIVADNPSIGALQALKRSKQMMNGYKWKYFRVVLRLLILAFLCIFTLGLGLLLLFPYAHVVFAVFYDDIKADFEISDSLESSSVSE